MENFGILLSIPVSFMMNLIYCALLATIVRRHDQLSRFLFTASFFILGLFLAEVVLLVSLGVVPSRAVVGPAFSVAHTVVFFLGTPALMNVLVLRKRASVLAGCVAIMLCTAFALSLVLLQYGVSEALYGQDGMSGPYSVLDDEEYVVLAAIVKQDNLAKSTKWFMVSDWTVSFDCSSAEKTGFSVGDCSGMRTANQTPHEALRIVQARMPSLPADLALDFLFKNNMSIRVKKPLPLSVKQVLWGPERKEKLPPGLGNPDFAIYPSRVAFMVENDGEEALAYVGYVSWVATANSFGEYVYLKKVGDSWEIKDRVRVWEFP